MKRKIVIILTLMSIELVWLQQDFSVDKFIVDEDTLYETEFDKPNHVNKKTNVLTPPLRSMAMSLQPTQQGLVVGKALGYKPKPSRTENADKRLHIAPTINLLQTLKTLNEIGENKMNTETRYLKKEEAKIKEKVENRSTEISNQDRLKKEFKKNPEHKNVQNRTKNISNSTAKKDAQPNMLTDSPVKGFLSKDVNFTIDDIGNAAKQKKINNVELKKQSSLSVSSLENKTAIPNISLYNRNSSQKTMNFNSHNSSNSNNFTSNNNAKINTSNRDTVSSVENKTQLNHTETNTTTSRKTLNDKQRNTSFKGKLTRKPNVHVVDVDDFSKIHYSNTTSTSLSALKKDSIDVNHDECNDEKKCPKNKYCRHFVCHECHRKHHECVEDDQCCDGLPCVYGRCDDKPKKSPGTICHKDGDCGEGCCVLEPTIDEEHGICKVKLAEYHQCSPVLFRKVWVGDEKPKCGPCQDGLECVEKGVIASHLICMKKH